MKIPECKGCISADCGPSPKQNRYFIRKIAFVSLTDGFNEDGAEVPGNPEAVNVIKDHVYKYGSAVAAFPVFRNFLNSKRFTEISDGSCKCSSYGMDVCDQYATCGKKDGKCMNLVNDSGEWLDTMGLYIESEDYNSTLGNGKKPCKEGKDDSVKGGSEFKEKEGDQQTPKDFLGCHAVTIVGWGIENRPFKLKSLDVEIKDIPFWIVRNSWGTTWGTNGYYKMPMYMKEVKDKDGKIVKNKDGSNYEMNLQTAFEMFRMFDASSPGQEGSQPVIVGGVILVEPGDIKDNEQTRKYGEDVYVRPPPPKEPEDKNNQQEMQKYKQELDEYNKKYEKILSYPSWSDVKAFYCTNAKDFKKVERGISDSDKEKEEEKEKEKEKEKKSTKISGSKIDNQKDDKNDDKDKKSLKNIWKWLIVVIIILFVVSLYFYFGKSSKSSKSRRR
jgi:uncharacterized membrane-anchored protein YhcB (DUF1043 family)